VSAFLRLLDEAEQESGREREQSAEGGRQVRNQAHENPGVLLFLYRVVAPSVPGAPGIPQSDWNRVRGKTAKDSRNRPQSGSPAAAGLLHLRQALFTGLALASRSFVAHSSQQTSTVLPPIFTWIVLAGSSG
jgi:hypothetical protein